MTTNLTFSFPCSIISLRVKSKINFPSVKNVDASFLLLISGNDDSDDVSNSLFCGTYSFGVLVTAASFRNVGVDVNVDVDDGNTFAKGDVSLQQRHLSVQIFIVMVVALTETVRIFFNKATGAANVFSTTSGDSSDANAAVDTVVVGDGEWNCFHVVIFHVVIFPGSSFAACVLPGLPLWVPLWVPLQVLI